VIKAVTRLVQFRSHLSVCNAVNLSLLHQQVRIKLSKNVTQHSALSDFSQNVYEDAFTFSGSNDFFYITHHNS